MTPKVSILIPQYNSECFIAETIQSALLQTYKNIEIIIVDDGSIDNSYVIAKTFESDKVKIFKQVNSGACSARNLAFEKSSGEYIQYLDADDLLAPDKIEQQMQLFKQFGNSIITSGVWGRFYTTLNNVRWEEQAINQDYSSPINWLADCWNGKGMMAQHVWLTPRNLIAKAGPWNESLKINQDGEFFSRVLMQANIVKFCSNAKVYYRSGNTGSVSQNNKNREKSSSLLLSYCLYKVTIKAHLGNPSIRRALANNFLNFIYQNHSNFPDLTQQAEEEFIALNVGKMWPVGSKRFKQIANLFGFRTTLRITRLAIYRTKNATAK